MVIFRENIALFQTKKQQAISAGKPQQVSRHSVEPKLKMLQYKRMSETLAQKMGNVPHISPLLKKLQRAGIASPDEMGAAAVQRGCFHYVNCFPAAAKSAPEISDEELAIALLSPANPYNPMYLRVGSQLLSKDSCNPEKLVALAKQERCESVLKHIAELGAETEPDNPFWKYLVAGLARYPNPKQWVMPHKSRFRIEAGIVNPLRPQPKIQWLHARTTH